MLPSVQKTMINTVIESNYKPATKRRNGGYLGCYTPTKKCHFWQAELSSFKIFTNLIKTIIPSIT